MDNEDCRKKPNQIKKLIGIKAAKVTGFNQSAIQLNCCSVLKEFLLMNWNSGKQADFRNDNFNMP